MEQTNEMAEHGISLWRALRSDPAHAADVAVLYALPQLSPHVGRWWQARRQRRPDQDPDAVARRIVMRAAGVARRGGIVTGSSFYVGMVPAMAMIYFEQVALVLRVAAVYGHDPLAPERAAEILVLQGRYGSVAEATAALRTVGRPAPERALASETRTVTATIRQMPSMLGLQARKLAHRSLLEHIGAAIKMISYFVPIVSIPVWAIVNASATRRLGRAAIAFYKRSGMDETPSGVILPGRPTRRARIVFVATVLPLALALGFGVTLLLAAADQHELRWVALVIGEASLLLIFARLVRITRVEPPAST